MWRVVMVGFIVGCGACAGSRLKTAPGTKSQTAIKVIKPDPGSHGNELTWVLIEQTTERYQTFWNEKQGWWSGKTVSNFKTVPVKTEREQALWLCYRSEDKSRPQCFRAKMIKGDTGGVELIGDYLRRLPKTPTEKEPASSDRDAPVPVETGGGRK